MSEFYEKSMDIPDSEPVPDIVEDTPPEAEPTPVPETAVDSSFDNEDTGEEAVENVVDDASVEAESNMDTGFDPELATESVEDIVPESDLGEEPFEAPQETPQEPDIPPDLSGVDFYDAGSAEPVFPGVERTELYHSPEKTREIEPGTGPNPSWDQPSDSSLNDHYPEETTGEDIRESLSETEGSKAPPPENLELLPDEMIEQLNGSASDFRGEDVVDEESPPETLDALPQTGQTNLAGGTTPEQSATPQVEQESKPKLYVDGEELTLPGDRGLEYRIGSPHQDFEDYKGIVNANRQSDIASATQTSDSLGEAMGTLAAASQEGTDFSEIDNYFYGKYGYAPYTDVAPSPATDIPASDVSAKDDIPSASSVEVNILEQAESQSAESLTALTTFKDSHERNITIRRWGEDDLIQLRAYDTDQGDVPETPNLGTAGMTNLKVESGLDGSTQIRLQDIVIPEDYRRSGIAGKMLDQTLGIARSKGASDVYGVIENEEALNYWKHMEEKGSGWKVDSNQGAYGYVRYEMRDSLPNAKLHSSEKVKTSDIDSSKLAITDKTSENTSAKITDQTLENQIKNTQRNRAEFRAEAESYGKTPEEYLAYLNRRNLDPEGTPALEPVKQTNRPTDSELPPVSVDTSSSTNSSNRTSDGSDSSNSSAAKNSKWSDEDQALLDDIQKARIEQEQELERELKKDLKPFEEPNPFDKPFTPDEQARLERIREARLHGHAVPATTLEIVDRAIVEHRVETFAEAQNKKNLPSEMRNAELKGLVQEANTSVHLQEKYTDSEVQVTQKDGSIRNLSADNPDAKYTIEYQGKLQKDKPDFIVRENSINEETGSLSSQIVEINDAKGYTRKDTKNPNASAESLTHMRQLNEATKYTNAAGEGDINVVFSLPEETARMQAVQDALAKKSKLGRQVKVDAVSSEAEISQIMNDMRHDPSERDRIPDEVFQEMEKIQQLPVEERLPAWVTYMEKFKDEEGQPSVIQRNIREKTTLGGDSITVESPDGKKYTISLK